MVKEPAFTGVGGLILGSLWALWHLPGFLIPSQDLTDIPPRGTVLEFVVFSLALIGLRLVIMWVYNNTRGSVLLAILTHASWNTFYSAAGFAQKVGVEHYPW